MSNQSPFVKVVIWFMVFLMSAGFIALVIAPFAGNTSLFGNDGGRGATEDLVAESRAEVEKDDCAGDDSKPTGARLERCQDALSQLGSAYMTLATPAEGDTEQPRDSRRNLERAGDAYRALYELDTKNADNAARYAGYLRDTGKTQQSLDIFTTLVKANPSNEDYLLQQAGAYQQLNDLDNAIKTLRAFVKRFPDSGQLESIRSEITALQEQQEQQAAGGGAAGGAPITVG